MSLEVAEHLPGECAEVFVESLINLGHVVMFSAAIPHQGGKCHLNEQWPEYWVKIFEGKKYVAIDYIRNRIWNSHQVEWWYANNIFIFVSQSYLKSTPSISKEYERNTISMFSVVHPKKYLEEINKHNTDLDTIWKYRTELANYDITKIIPSNSHFIFVDQGMIEYELSDNRYAIPFIERNGKYWGQPSDDSAAIKELERLRHSGANFIAFVWPAFWWLDHYSEFNKYLRSKFPCVKQNERLIMFDIR